MEKKNYIKGSRRRSGKLSKWNLREINVNHVFPVRVYPPQSRTMSKHPPHPKTEESHQVSKRRDLSNVVQIDLIDIENLMGFLPEKAMILIHFHLKNNHNFCTCCSTRFSFLFFIPPHASFRFFYFISIFFFSIFLVASSP